MPLDHKFESTLKALLLPAVFITLLPLQLSQAEETSAKDLAKLLEEFATEEKIKRKYSLHFR